MSRLTAGSRFGTAAIGFVVAAFAISAHFYLPTQTTRLSSEILRSLHGPGFTLVTLVFFWLARDLTRKPVRFLIAGTAAALLAVVSEAAQIPGPRNAEWTDLLADAIGIAAALGLLALLDSTLRRQAPWLTRAALWVVTFAMLTITFLPTMFLGYATVQQKRAFPALLTFEHSWESVTFTCPDNMKVELVPAPLDWPGTGESIASIHKGSDKPVFLILHPASDWRSYKALSFLAASAGSPFSVDVAIRFSDAAGELPSRFFEKSFQLSTTPQRLAIPFDEIDMIRNGQVTWLAHVESVVFSPTRPGSAQQLLIDDVRLEP